MHSQRRDISGKTAGVESERQRGNETQWWKDFKARPLAGLWKLFCQLVYEPFYQQNEVYYKGDEKFF